MKGERTKKMLVDTIIGLSREKTLDKVNVADIATAAGVSRQTFYYHFESIFAAYSWTLRRDMKYGHLDMDSDYLPNPKAYISDACRAISANREFTQAMIDGGFSMQMRMAILTDLYPLCRKYIADLGVTGPERALELLANFQAEGNIGILMQWLNDGMPDDIDTVLPEFYRMMLEELVPAILERIQKTKTD